MMDMELKNITGLEIQLNDQVYQFTCSPTAPAGGIYDALTAFREFIIKKINDSESQAKKPDEILPSEG